MHGTARPRPRSRTRRAAPRRAPSTATSPPAPVPDPHPPQVAIELAARDEIGQRELLDHGRAAVGEPLGERQLTGQPRRAQHPAEPQRRDQPLARRADVAHALRREALERAERPAVEAQLRVVVVLDDQPLDLVAPRPAAPLGARMTSRRRSGTGARGSRRPSHSPMPPARRRRGPLVVRRDRDRLESSPSAISRCCAQPGSSIAIRSIPRSRSDVHRRPKRLREAGADERVLGLGRGAARSTEVFHQRVSQLRRAARIAVAERVVRRVAQRGAQRAQPAIARERGEVGQCRIEAVRVPRLRQACGQRRELGARPRGDPGRRTLARDAGTPRRRADCRPRARRLARRRARPRARAMRAAAPRAPAARCGPARAGCSSSCACSGPAPGRRSSENLRARDWLSFLHQNWTLTPSQFRRTVLTTDAAASQGAQQWTGSRSLEPASRA